MKSLIVIAALAAAPAAAQMQCSASPGVYERLAVDWAEARIGEGMVENGQAIVEVWANRETGTWTVLVTRPDGLSCMAASGSAWQDVAAAAPGTDG